MPADHVYRERLLPGVLPLVVGLALVGVFAIALGAPLGAWVGWLVLALGIGTLATWAWVSSPVIEVTGAHLRVGRARLPRTSIASVQALDADAAREASGPRADARQYLELRSLASPRAVRITLDDPDDPHPFWLVSTRHPERLAGALQ